MKAKRKSSSFELNPEAFFAARKKRQLRSAAVLLLAVGLFIAVLVLVRNYNESNRPIDLFLDRGGSATIAEIQSTRSASKLKELASTVMPRLQTASLEQQKAILKILSAISKRQIELARTDEERNQGIRNNLVALQLRASSENPDEDEPLSERLENLEEFASEHLSNSNGDVSLDACQGLFVVEKLRLKRASPGEGTVERTGKMINEVVAKFPKEVRVMGMIEGLLELVPRRTDQNRDLETLMTAIENAYKTNPSEISANWLAILRDKQLLVETELLNVLPGAEKGNEKAIARVIEIAEILLTHHKSFFGVERGVELALLLEANGATKDALRLMENFERAATAFPKGQTSNLSQRVKLAIGRMGLLEQPFPLAGKDLQGNEISLSAYDGKIVFVCFVRKATEAQRIGKTLSRLVNLEKQGVRGVMVVPVGLINNAQKSSDSFLSIVETPQGKSDLFSECHIDADFCWFLVGKSGKTEKFGVSPELAINLIEKWAFE